MAHPVGEHREQSGGREQATSDGEIDPPSEEVYLAGLPRSRTREVIGKKVTGGIVAGGQNLCRQRKRPPPPGQRRRSLLRRLTPRRRAASPKRPSFQSSRAGG